MKSRIAVAAVVALCLPAVRRSRADIPGLRTLQRAGASKGAGEDVRLPRQPHGIQEPKLVKDAMERNLEWFEKWIKAGARATASEGTVRR